MAARGWFRRPKGRLVYVWQVKDPATGKAKERAMVIGHATLSDEEGWQKVGKLKAEGTIKTDHEPSADRSFSDIASFYLANKEWKKESTKVLHTQIVNKILVPRWGAQVAVKVKPVEVKAWLRSLDLEDGTRYKYKTVMGTVFRFGQAEGLLPLGEAYNPIGYVTGIPATSDYEAVVLTPEQALKVLDQLQQPEYTMIVLVAVTGIRSGEMLGLRWRDILWDRSEMKIKQTFVHGKIQQGAKTKLSKSTVTLHPILAELLKDWRAQTACAGENDYVFASRRTSGRTPRCGSVVVEDYLRPAAIRAEVLEIDDDKVYIDGDLVKRFGFHTFRHSLTSWLMANGENPQIVRAMLRWTNLNMLAHYTHGFKTDKLEAQGAVLKKLVRSGNTSNRESERELEETKTG
jgi:integrase